jgi:hypothetical protein
MNRSNSLIATAVILLASGSVLAAGPSLPLHRPGLWQQTMTQDGVTNPNASSQVCYDPASETKIAAMGDQFSNKNCPSRQVVHNPDGSWTMSGTCTFQQGWKTTSRATLAGDFNTEVTTTIDATTVGAPAPPMNGAHHTVLLQTWLGPCKPGQRGGDVIMDDGTTMNMLDEPGNSDGPPGAPEH